MNGVAVSTMPSGLRRKLDYVLKNVIDNHETYERRMGGREGIARLSFVNERVQCSMSLSEEDIILCGAAFYAYYKSEERVEQLYEWWKAERSKQVLVGLGT